MSCSIPKTALARGPKESSRSNQQPAASPNSRRPVPCPAFRSMRCAAIRTPLHAAHWRFPRDLQMKDFLFPPPPPPPETLSNPPPPEPQLDNPQPHLLPRPPHS